MAWGGHTVWLPKVAWHRLALAAHTWLYQEAAQATAERAPALSPPPPRMCRTLLAAAAAFCASSTLRLQPASLSRSAALRGALTTAASSACVRCGGKAGSLDQ